MSRARAHAATEVGHRYGTPGYRRISIALFVAGLSTFASLYSTQPLLPELADHFNVSAAQSALTVSMATIALGITLLVAGPLSEVWGRTRLIHLSTFSTGVIGVLCALAPSWSGLLVLRTIQGVALAGLPAIAMAYLREEVHRDSHARAAGLYIAGVALGGMSGRLIAGGLADLGGWRWALGGIAVFALGCALTARLLLPPSRNFQPSLPQPSALLRQAGRLLRDPAQLTLYALAGSLMGAIVGVFNTIGFRLTGDPYGLSYGAVGLIFLVYALGSASSAYAGNLASRHGREVVVSLGCLVAVVGVVLTLVTPLPLVIVGLAIMTSGFFAAYGVSSGWVAAHAHEGPGGTAQATSFYLFTYYLGAAIFGSLAGGVWSLGGWPLVVTLSAGLFVVALALSLLLVRLARHPRTT